MLVFHLVIKIYMKKLLSIILVVTFVVLGLLLSNPLTSHAFPAVLGTKVVGEQSISVDGNEVVDPKISVPADSTTPTFTGYLTANTKLLLIIRSNALEAESLTDANGYWRYTTEKPLEVGQHTLSVKLVDKNDITSKENLIATFDVPEVKASATSNPIETPLPKISKVNYFSVSLIILGSVLLLVIIYIFINRKPR